MVSSSASSKAQKNSKKFLDFFPAPQFLEIPFTGVSISSDAVRCVEILKTKNGAAYKLGSYGEEKIDVAKRGHEEEIKRALIVLKNKFKLRYIKASLPEDKAFLFRTKVAGSTEEEIRSNIEFTLEENVPVSGSDALFDFHIISKDKATNMQEVAVSVFPRQIIEHYMDLFHSCQLYPIGFLIEASAFARAIVSRQDDGAYILVHTDEARTMLAIISERFVQFSSTVDVSSNSFLNAETKDNAIETIRAEIERLYTYWKSRDQQKDDIQKVICSGKVFMEPHIIQKIAEPSRLVTSLANVWVNVLDIEVSTPPIALTESFGYTIPIGLAIPKN